MVGVLKKEKNTKGLFRTNFYKLHLHGTNINEKKI
jgi:hypothetical protein